MKSVWRLAELLSVTGGELIGSIEEDAVLGGIVYPLSLVADNSVVVHCSTPDWPKRPARLSGQAGYDLEGLLDAAKKRSAALIITSGLAPESPPLPVIRVADSHRAFFQLALHARDRFQGRVIAVTGTVGKSTTRDILGRFLSRTGTCLTSFGNWNTVEGSAMCLSCLPADADFVVVEQSEESIRGHHGYSSVDTVRPDELVVTKLGFGKVQQFTSIEVLADVISRQVESLPDNGRLYFSSDVQCRDVLESAARSTATHVVGEVAGDDIEVQLLGSSFDGSAIRLSSGQENLEIEARVIGEGWIENIRLAALCAHKNGVAIDQISQEIQRLEPIPRKMELANPIIAGRKVTLLDDSHNAEVQSFENALSLFGRAARNFSRRIVIAGKIVYIEGGEKYVYNEIARFISGCDPFAVILHGDGMKWLARALQKNGTTVLRAAGPSDVLALLETVVDDNTALMLKGSSRNTRMKELSALLRSGPQWQSTPVDKGRPQLGDKIRSRIRKFSTLLRSGAQGLSARLDNRQLGLPQRIRDGITNPRELRLAENHDVSVGFLGDTYFGEYYAEKALASGKPHPLHGGDYEGWIADFESFLSANAINVANLETPLTERETSPYRNERPYPHRADPEKTLRALTRAGINVVTLGNNHLFDYARAGINDTLAQFRDSSIVAIGAGENAQDAARPLAVRVDRDSGAAVSPASRELLVFSGFAYSSAMEERFKAYAKARRPGCNPVNRHMVAAVALARRQHPQALIVVVPHWQRDYHWASQRQRRFARDVLAAGADLLIGHGAHMLQQTERFGGRLAVHGLGNFIFNSPGRTRQMFAPPISAVARLIIAADPARPVHLRLYPIFTDNRTSGYRTRLLGEEEFTDHMSRYVRLGFLPRNATLTRDDIGNCIEMALTAAPENPDSP